MNSICLPACSRVFVKIQCIIAAVLIVLMGFAGQASAQVAPTGPKIWLGERQPLAMQQGTGAASVTRPAGGRASVLTGDPGTALAPAGAAAQPLSLATGDVNEDGFADLLVGYNGYISIQPGNIDAFAPQSDASFQAIGRGQFPAPFLAQGLQLATPVNPDFMAVGHFTASGHNDLAVGAKGGTALFVFAGDGHGNFAAPQQLNLPGGISALTGGNLGYANGFQNVIAGLNGASGPELAIFTGSKDGLNPVAAFPLSGAPANFNFGDFGDGGNDLAFLAGGKVNILRAATMKLQTVSLPVSATGLALGTFVNDRIPGLQMALLTADGALHIAVHNEFDPRAYTLDELQALSQSGKLRTEFNPLLPAKAFPASGWKIVEDISAGATFPAGQAPVLFRTRISDHQMDDVMVISGSTGLLTVVQHPDVQPGAATFAPAILSTRPYSGNAIAAIPQRTNIDGRAGIVAIHANEGTPSILQPLPDPTFFVNRTDDPTPGAVASICNNVSSADTSTSCSLREAIIKANATAGTDTISVPAGTFTLTLARLATDHHTSLQGTLEVQDSVNIVGAGQNTTIIQGGTSLATSVDKVISFNQDIDSFTNATVSVSNLTIQNGNNKGTAGGVGDGFGGAFDFDTGNPGTATLTMTNVTIQNNAVTNGQGGGFTMFNTKNSTGFATLTNVIVQNNDSTANTNGVAGDGGGGVIDARSKIVMSNVQVLTNHTHPGGPGPTNPTGGGLFFQGQHTQPQSHISGSTISGNTAVGTGGGINNIATLLIDGGTVISNNTAGTNANNVGGGGIQNNSADGTTLSKVTISGNTTTGDGGAIYTGNNSGGNVMTITFSRLAGNTSSHLAGSNEIFNFTAAAPGNTGNQVTVTNSWVGTNVPGDVISQGGTPAVSSCPIAAPNNGVCFDPFIVLTHSATPSKIRINQSTTLTGDMSKDNHGNGAALAGNLDRIVGLPITFNNPVLGTIPQAQPETLNVSAQATATFNAGGTSGRGSADATVDQGVIGANSNFIASATEAGTTVTITTVGVHNFSTDNTVVISGVGVGGYNGTFTITSTPTPTTFTYTTTAGLGASSGGTADMGIIILEPPQITKSFGAATIPVNGTTTVNFSINNPNVVAINASFTDTLPTGLQVAATPGVTSTCGGTVTAVAGSGSISFSNNLTPVGICTISVNITGTVDNNYTNSVQILSTDAGNGNTSSANITVINPPSITKQFGAATIPLNGTTSLTFTLSSTNVNLTINGAAFTDNLPAGLVVATPPNVSGTCTGTVTATAGSSSVSLSGQTLAPGTSCTVSVNVQGTTAGIKNNSVQATSTNAGTGNTSNASITVVAPPTISKAFGAASIPLNGTTTVTFTINNPNATVGLSGVAFSDTLPNATGTLVVAAVPGVTNTCGGTVTATAGTGVISLSGASVTQNSSCTLSVNVTGTAAGDAVNTTGAITSTEGGTGTTSNTATIKIVAPPTISKAFGAAAIPLNGTTTATFTITNPAANTTSEDGIAFSDTLTGGLQVASTPGVSNTCGGTVTAAANSTSISLTGGSIATPGSTCTIVVNVTGTQSGTVSNTTGAVSSTNGGTGATSNTATLIVASPATVTKVFGATKIPLNGTTSLTINITNPNTNVTLTGLSFTDNLPAGLVIATPNGLSNTCGGTATATAGSGALSLSGGTVAASASCAVTVNVTGTTAGDKINSVTVSSTEGGASNAASATLTVVAPPTISKAFGAASIPLNGTTSVTFTISNPNNPATPANGDLTGVAFSDTLPVSGGPGSATLVVAATPGVTNTCGGTVTATAGTGVISLSGGSVAHNASCTLTVNVTGTVEGDANNTTGAITSTEGGTGTASNTATIKVAAPPTISKAFGAAAITLNGTTTVTFTITNPASNTTAENGIAFSDTLTGGLQVASTPGVSNTCGGTVTAAANSTSISLTGGSIATPGSTCTIVVNVTGTQSGTVTNTTGAVSSTNGGTGATSNTATLTVASPPAITKTFGAASIPLSGTTSLTFNISNPNTNVTLTGVAFTDNLPSGLVVAPTPNLSNTCGGTATATAGSGTVSLSGATIAASASCTVSVDVQGTTAGVKNNSVQVTSTEGGTGNTSNASVTVTGPAVIIKAFGAASIPLNGSTSLSFTIQNNNTTVALSGVAFSDTLPAGLVISTPNGLTGTCGAGTITATQGTNVISLSGGTIAASSSCTFSVNVTGTAAGTQNNTTGNVTSTEGGTGGTASASINVVAPPSIAKVFNPSNIALNATTSLTFTITNPAANAVSLAGVAFTDTLPTGLTVANATSSVCGGTLTTTNPTGIALSGATIAANGQCQFSVTVTGAAAGQFTNTTGNVTSTNGGTGNTASANLTVATPPTITKAFGAASILLNASTSLTFNISNPNTSIGLTGIAFSDTLPAGLVVATPSGLTNTGCGGTATAAAGSGSISLTGGTLAANGSCTITLNVTGVAAGVQNNTTGPISSTESGAGATSNTASITVIGPPSIAKAFGAASINLNATTTLTFTITNPNATVALAGVGFGDTLPAGLAVANPNGLTGSCGSGTITTGTVSGFSVVNLANGTIAAGGSCTFSVNVVGQSGGHKVNTTGTVTSSNAGSGNQATATIDVLAPDPTIAKTHTGTFTRGQTGAQWTITVSNVGFGPTVGTVTVVDTLPNVQNPPVPTAMSGTGWTCTLATLTCTRADALPSGSAYPPITLTVNIPQNIQNNFTNTATVSGGGDVNPNNNTATDSISLGPPLVITPHSSSSSTVKAGGSAQIIFDVENDTGATVTFGCSGLPVGASCTFNPPANTQAISQVTMTLSTSSGGSNAVSSGALLGPGNTPPLYAAMVPLLGLLGFAMTGRKNRKKTRLRLALVFAGLMTLLTLAGCGGAHGITTPAGTYSITVTASTTTVQASTQITLGVQ